MVETKKYIEHAPDAETGELDTGYRKFIDAETERGAKTDWNHNLPGTLRDLAKKVFDEDGATAELFAEELLDNIETMLGLRIFKKAARKIASVEIKENFVRFLDKNGEVVKLKPGEYAESEYTLEFPVRGSDRLIAQAKKAEILEKNADLRGEFLQDELSEDERAAHLREAAALNRFERRGIANLRECEATKSFIDEEQKAGGPAFAPAPQPPESGGEKTAEKSEFLSAEEADKIVAMRAELDRDLAKAWVVNNQPFEEIVDPLGRAKLIPALKPEPLAMGPAQLRRMLRENHQISTLTMQDFLSEHGLNLEVNASTIKIEYLDLLNRKEALSDDEKNRLTWLDSLFKQVKSVLEIVGNQNIFYAKEFKQAEAKKEELPENETDQKILEKLADIFDPNMRGYLDERTGRIMDIVDMDNRTHTVLKEDYLKASGEAMYEHTRKKIWSEAQTPEARLTKTQEILNIYLKLALINEKQEDRYEKLKINSLSVSDEVKHLLRKGYQEHRLAETSMLREEHESVYSAEEHLQKLGERIKERYSLTHKETRELIRKVEQHLIGGVMAGLIWDRTEGEFEPILGLAGNIDLGKGFNLHVGISGVKPPDEDWKTHLHAGGTYHFKPSKDYSMDISIGYAHAISKPAQSGVSAGVRMSIPVAKENDLVLGLGAGTPLTTLRLFPTGEIGSSWNPERALENKKAGFEELLKNPDNEKFYEDFKTNHPELFQRFEKMLSAYSGTENAPALDEKMQGALARAWISTLNRKASDLAIEELESPSIPDYGIAVVAAPPGFFGLPFIPIPYFTISLGGKTEVIRVMSPGSEEIPDEVFKKALADKGVETKNAEIITIAEDGPIALDQEGRPRILSKEDAKYEFSETDSLQSLNAAFQKIGLEFELESNKKLLHMSIKDAERATIKVHLDPELKNVSLVHDQRDFYLSLSAEQELIITRINYEYPFPHEGSVRGVEIFIKANPDRGESVIRNEEKAFLERLKNGLIREGGDRTKLNENSIWSMEDFGDKGMTFDMMNMAGMKEAAERIFKATHLEEKKETAIRGNLQELIKTFYEQGNKKRIASLMTEYDRSVKYDPKELIKEINHFLKNKNEQPLTNENPLEIMFTWNILTEQTLRELKGTPEKRKKQIEKDIRAFVRKDLIELFGQTSQADHAETMAEVLVRQMSDTTFQEKEKGKEGEDWEKIAPETTGNLFLTMVRHFGIHGLRRSLDYDNRDYVLINHEEYKLNDADSVKKSIAIAILELQSPLKDRARTHEYLNQFLPLKLAKFAPLIMDAEHVTELAELYEAKEKADNLLQSDAKYKEALDKFKEFATAVREAEKSGAQSVTYTGPFGEFELTFESVKVTAGIFERCGNFTIVAKEDFKARIEKKLPSHRGAQEKVMVTVEAEKTKIFSKIALLFPFATQERAITAKKEIPPPPPEEQPEAGHSPGAKGGEGLETPSTSTPTDTGTKGHGGGPPETP